MSGPFKRSLRNLRGARETGVRGIWWGAWGICWSQYVRITKMRKRTRTDDGWRWWLFSTWRVHFSAFAFFFIIILFIIFVAAAVCFALLAIHANIYRFFSTLWVCLYGYISAAAVCVALLAVPVTGVNLRVGYSLSLLLPSFHQINSFCTFNASLNWGTDIKQNSRGLHIAFFTMVFLLVKFDEETLWSSYMNHCCDCKSWLLEIAM